MNDHSDLIPGYHVFKSEGEELAKGYWVHTPQGGIGPFEEHDEAAIYLYGIKQSLEKNNLDTVSSINGD